MSGLAIEVAGLRKQYRAVTALDGIDFVEWAAHCRTWRDRLAVQPDLSSALIAFVASRR